MSVTHNGDTPESTERCSSWLHLHCLQDQIKTVSMWNGSKNPWKIIERLKSNFPANFSEISVGPWRLPNVHWETNKTFERSLKDHLTYSLRSSRDQSRSLRDWSRPLREQLRSLRDLWDNKSCWSYSSPPAISQQFFSDLSCKLWSLGDLHVSRSLVSIGFHQSFNDPVNDLSIIFQWSWSKIVAILERLSKDNWKTSKTFERSLRDCWKTIFMKDCQKTILNRFKRFWRPWNSLKDHLGIMKDLGDHWKFTERSVERSVNF